MLSSKSVQQHVHDVTLKWLNVSLRKQASSHPAGLVAALP